MQEIQQRPKIEEVKKCPDCGSEEIIRDKAERYCKKCGFVID